jgi:hypothetical protein
MGNSGNPRQSAAGPGCHERHLGGLLRNVKLGVSAVIHTYFVKRELTAVRYRPLVRFLENALMMQ